MGSDVPRVPKRWAQAVGFFRLLLAPYPLEVVIDQSFGSPKVTKDGVTVRWHGVRRSPQWLISMNEHDFTGCDFATQLAFRTHNI